MRLYFVRHGETKSNLQKTVVSITDQLTETGREQARVLAERFSNISVDLILSSPQKRAKETATTLADRIGKKVEVLDFLSERKWPKEIEGKPLHDSEVKKVLDLLRKNVNNPTWHYSYEENFLDVKKRASVFVEYVSSLTFENIIAVSHEYFIKMVITVMMHGDQLSHEIFKNFNHFTILSSTSLALCEKNKDEWKLVTLNNQDDLV